MLAIHIHQIVALSPRLISRRLVLFAVAGEGAVAMLQTGADIFDLSAGGGRHIGGVEIDEMRRVGHAVRIVAGGAGGLVVHNVRLVEPETGGA